MTLYFEVQTTQEQRTQIIQPFSSPYKYSQIHRIMLGLIRIIHENK
jgi:hypothetical protein